eukprot:scaffold133895_cov34-Tisochrysis_lutea.AAC.1
MRPFEREQSSKCPSSRLGARAHERLYEREARAHKPSDKRGGGGATRLWATRAHDSAPPAARTVHELTASDEPCERRGCAAKRRRGQMEALELGHVERSLRERDQSSNTVQPQPLRVLRARRRRRERRGRRPIHRSPLLLPLLPSPSSLPPIHPLPRGCAVRKGKREGVFDSDL